MQYLCAMILNPIKKYKLYKRAVRHAAKFRLASEFKRAYWFFGFSVIDAIEDFDLLTVQFLNENRKLLG